MTTVDAGAAVRRGPGRPRDEEIDGQIIAATLALIDAEEEVTVSRVVEHSGVSRAALYRRWPSLTMLIAAALDVGRTVPPPMDAEGDLYAAVVGAVFGDSASVTASGYSEVRFRHRIRLVMGDRALQRAYWRSHVSRRRVPVEAALCRGIERGSCGPISTSRRASTPWRAWPTTSSSSADRGSRTTIRSAVRRAALWPRRLTRSPRDTRQSGSQTSVWIRDLSRHL